MRKSLARSESFFRRNRGGVAARVELVIVLGTLWATCCPPVSKQCRARARSFSRRPHRQAAKLRATPFSRRRTSRDIRGIRHRSCLGFSTSSIQSPRGSCGAKSPISLTSTSLPAPGTCRWCTPVAASTPWAGSPSMVKATCGRMTTSWSAHSPPSTPDLEGDCRRPYPGWQARGRHAPGQGPLPSGHRSAGPDLGHQ